MQCICGILGHLMAGNALGMFGGKDNVWGMFGGWIDGQNLWGMFGAALTKITPGHAGPYLTTSTIWKPHPGPNAASKAAAWNLGRPSSGESGVSGG